MSFDNSSSPGNCLSNTHVAAATETKALLKTGPVNLYGLIAENNHTADVFLQIFNAASTADVTVGTTVADFSIRLPASGALILDNHRAFKHFNKGVVYAVTLTRTGAGSPVTGATLTFSFSAR